MPTKYEKLRVGKENDRRIKLNDKQRDEVKELRKQGLSYAKIAKNFDVSKGLIIMICNPDIAERKRKQFIERSREGRYRYPKEQRNKYMREHRRYKRKLYEDGLISNKEIQ